MKKIILASTSPRRHSILRDLGLIFEIKKPTFEENTINLKFSYKVIEYFALNKARSIINKVKEPAIIISADTMVVYKDEILGKPKSKDNAIEILEKLNGKQHKVITAIAMIDTENEIELTETATSGVCFNKIPKENILSYIEGFEPYDKAGAYGIQEIPESFVKNIDGELDNIIGLPSKVLIEMLTKLNK